MTALKVLVACVSIVVMGILVAIPYKLNETAGVVCLACGVIGALGALSARLREAMVPASRSAQRFLDRRYGRVVVVLLLVFPVFLRDVLPEVVTWVHIGVVWSLGICWLSYKVVETLRGPPAEPESGAA